MPAIPISTREAPLPAEAASFSFRALPLLLSTSSSSLSTAVARAASLSSQYSSAISKMMSRSVSSSSQHTTSTVLAARFASSSSSIAKRDNTVPAPVVLGIIAFTLALTGFLLTLARAYEKDQHLEAERIELNFRSPRRTLTMDYGPELLRRTTTGRIRDDWQQWIAKPSPTRNGLKDRESAILFGPGAGSRLSSEPFLSAHEVEVSGVLSSGIADPPPAYISRGV